MSDGFYERLFGVRGKVVLVTGGTAHRDVTESFPMKRWGRMEDAAGLTIFLSSRAGSYLTGQTIPCDGGATTLG